MTWDAAQSPDLKQFEAHLQWGAHRDGLYAANTVYQALRMIRSFYRWAKSGDLVLSDPTEGWILPRPRSAPDRLLTQVELLQLFNLPDLARPTGQRDALVLALIFYAGYNLNQCIRLRRTELTGTDQADPALRAALDRYLRQARACVAARDQPLLLLTRGGQPLTDSQTLRIRLQDLGRLIGHPNLSVRVLRKTRRAHEIELSKRQGHLL